MQVIHKNVLTENAWRFKKSLTEFFSEWYCRSKCEENNVKVTFSKWKRYYIFLLKKNVIMRGLPATTRDFYLKAKVLILLHWANIKNAAS